jgi:hypothetical protein
MGILAVIWFIVLTVEAIIVGVSGHLPWTAAFIFALCISGLFFLKQNWLYGFIGLCICGILFFSVYSYEPNWFTVIKNTPDLLK